jgi:hypothetical protein
VKHCRAVRLVVHRLWDRGVTHAKSLAVRLLAGRVGLAAGVLVALAALALRRCPLVGWWPTWRACWARGAIAESTRCTPH